MPKEGPISKWIMLNIIWFELHVPNYKILICAVYRSPSANHPFWDNFQASIERAYESAGKVMITGDLNVNLFVETNNKLSDIINIFNIKYVVKEPNRNGSLLNPVNFR